MDDTWSFSQSFGTQFQAMRSELESQIASAKALPLASAQIIQELSVLLAKASKALADATGSIPSYDQKQYEIQLKSFEKSIEELRELSAPKSKFTFKRKPLAATPNPVTTVPKVPQPIIPPSVTSSSSSHLVLSARSREYVTRSSLPEHSQRTDLTIYDLDNCIVDLIPTRISEVENHLVVSALHARNLRNCVIILPPIEGSALLHDVTNCIIVLGSHQFRMHSSQKIDVFLSISSNPIIEDCNGIRFTQYPKDFQTSAEASKEQMQFTVQDFSHIRATPSPHFSYMTEAEKEFIERWLLATHQSYTYTETLSSIIPK